MKTISHTELLRELERLRPAFAWTPEIDELILVAREHERKVLYKDIARLIEMKTGVKLDKSKISHRYEFLKTMRERDENKKANESKILKSTKGDAK